MQTIESKAEPNKLQQIISLAYEYETKIDPRDEDKMSNREMEKYNERKYNWVLEQLRRDDD